MHALLATILLSASTAAPHRTKVAVLDIASPDDQKAKAALLTPVVVSEFAKQPALQVISAQEVAATLGYARQRQLLGCAEDSCLAEIGGALGVDYLVTGTLGHIGTRYRLDVRLVRAGTGGIMGSVGDFISGSDDALADATVRLTDALVAQLANSSNPGVAAAAQPAGGLATSAPAPVSHTSAYAAWGAGGALLAGAVAMTLVTRSTFNDVQSKHITDRSDPEASSLNWKGPLADGLWVAAVASAGVGTYLYFSAAPSGGSGGEVGVRGGF